VVVAQPRARKKVLMSFSVAGDYFEACTCTVSCPCIFLAPATRDTCDVFFAWHVARGDKDGVDLSGLNVALAARSPKQMTDGGWTVALYLDERAEPGQAEALGAIFSGQAGGHLANVVPLIGTVAGMTSVPIEFVADGNDRRVRVGEVAAMSVEQLVGMDGQNPAVITNPMLGAVAQPVRQARARELRYNDTWSFSAEGTNGFITEFSYAG
jgi:hypothetical protein